MCPWPWLPLDLIFFGSVKCYNKQTYSLSEYFLIIYSWTFFSCWYQLSFNALVYDLMSKKSNSLSNFISCASVVKWCGWIGALRLYTINFNLQHTKEKRLWSTNASSCWSRFSGSAWFSVQWTNNYTSQAVFSVHILILTLILTITLNLTLT